MACRECLTPLSLAYFFLFYMRVPFKNLPSTSPPEISLKPSCEALDQEILPMNQEKSEDRLPRRTANGNCVVGVIIAEVDILPIRINLDLFLVFRGSHDIQVAGITKHATMKAAGWEQLQEKKYLS